MATISLNQSAFLPQAIESVLAQEHSEIEYIIVDPGSVDGSRDVIESYGNRIARVLFEPDAGPADGLNKALRLATGEIWACVNADDLLLPHAVSSAARAFENDPLLDVAYADGLIVDAHLSASRLERSDEFSVWRQAYGIGMVVQQSTFIRRETALRVGGYNAANRTCWDGELLLELGLAGARMRRIEDIWGVFRIHADSITGSGRVTSLYESDRRRLFSRAIGREWRSADSLVVLAARAFKVARNLRRPVRYSISPLALEDGSGV